MSITLRPDTTAQPGAEPDRPPRGTPRKEQRSRWSFRNWLAVLGLLVLVAAFAWYPRASRIHTFPHGLIQVNGRIEGDRVTVSSKYAGRIARLLAREGDEVRAGQPLAQLEDGESRARLHQAEANLQALLAQGSGARETVALTSETAQAEVEEAEAVLQQARSGVASTQAEVARAAAVIEAGRSTVRGGHAAATAAAASCDAAEASRQGAVDGVSVATAARDAAAATRRQSREATAAAQSQVEAGEAQVRAAGAAVDSALAQFERATREARRYEALFAEGALSASARDAYVAAEKTALAQLTGARETMSASAKELEARRSALRQSRDKEVEAEALWNLRLAEVDTRRRQVLGAEAAVRQAAAQREAAEESVRGAGAQVKEAEAREKAARAAVSEARGRVRQAEGALKQARAAPRKVTVSRASQAEVAARIRQARATVDELRSIQESLLIRAPASGTVTTRMQDTGEVVSAGTPLLEIVDLDRLYLKVFVPETEIGRVRLGLPAQVYTDAFPHQPFPAVVRYVASRAEFTPKEVQTRSERVKLVYSVKLYLTVNPEHRLTPGVPADAVIRWKETTPWLEPRW